MCGFMQPTSRKVQEFHLPFSRSIFLRSPCVDIGSTGDPVTVRQVVRAILMLVVARVDLVTHDVRKNASSRPVIAPLRHNFSFLLGIIIFNLLTLRRHS
eukprot:Skav217615  [mRNA]  locus=scaffold2172:350162:352139:- [translate_table: standard]